MSEVKMSVDGLTKDEISLLLYFETCAVDYSGRVDERRMNDDDRKIAEKWNRDGFIQYGRICFEDARKDGASWVHLSMDALEIVAKLRQIRSERQWTNRRYKTTDEKRAES